MDCCCFAVILLTCVVFVLVSVRCAAFGWLDIVWYCLAMYILHWVVSHRLVLSCTVMYCIARLRLHCVPDVWLYGWRFVVQCYVCYVLGL